MVAPVAPAMTGSAALGAPWRMREAIARHAGVMQILAGEIAYSILIGPHPCVRVAVLGSARPTRCTPSADHRHHPRVTWPTPLHPYVDAPGARQVLRPHTTTVQYDPVSHLQTRPSVRLLSADASAPPQLLERFSEGAHRPLRLGLSAKPAQRTDFGAPRVRVAIYRERVFGRIQGRFEAALVGEH